MLFEDFISGVVSVTRFPQQYSCNIPSERTCMGHNRADLCQQPPRGINHSLRSFLAIKVSDLEKNAQTAFKPGLTVSFQQWKNRSWKFTKSFLAERTWRERFRWGCCCSRAHFENIPVRNTRAHLKGNKQIHRQGYTFMRYSFEKFALPLWNPDKI